MTKILLALTFAFSVFFANSQCIPDPQFTSAGIYPDTATGLGAAYVNQSYSQDITVITPTDTVVDVLGNMVEVTIDSISLTSVSGLPSDFSYSCDPPSCGFPGGTVRCAELFSTIDPAAADIGLYPIVFETTSYASNVPFLGTFTQDDVIDYYYIEISPATSTINTFHDNTFELKGAYPNPSIDKVKIQFISGNADNIVFTVYNLLGEEIDLQLISPNKGINTINLNTAKYSEGIYLYSLNNGNKVQTKRMIVKN
jgi:hypothetical protein